MEHVRAFSILLANWRERFGVGSNQPDQLNQWEGQSLSTDLPLFACFSFILLPSSKNWFLSFRRAWVLQDALEGLLPFKAFWGSLLSTDCCLPPLHFIFCTGHIKTWILNISTHQTLAAFLPLLCKVKFGPLLSCVRLLAIPWTVAHQTPLSIEFSRQEYRRWLPFPPARDLLNPGIKPSPHLLCLLHW